MANENPKSTQPKTATESSATLPLAPTAASTPSESELAAKAKALEEREKLLLQRELAADSKDTQRLGSTGAATAVPAASANPDMLEKAVIINNGRRAIGVPGGFVLYPGVNTIPRYAWARMFGPNGKATAGASEHVDSQNGQRPEVQEVSLKNLAQLPDEHALAAIEASSDEAKLSAHEQTEARDTVRSAISERLRTLRGQKDGKQ